MSDYVGSLRELGDLMSGAADELERITQLAIERAGEIIELRDAMALQREKDGDEIVRLKQALDDLIDEQNGPPLYQHAKSWHETMAVACRLTGRDAESDRHDEEVKQSKY